MLAALEKDVEPLRDRMAQDSKDLDIFKQLAGSDVVWVSTDTKQTTRQQEARAIKQAGITSLFFGPFYQKMQFWDQAVWVVKTWPAIKAFAGQVTKGTCTEIKRNGSALVYKL